MPPQKPVPLPAKEAGFFKTLLSQYESKQHKKAIKTADTILKKFPEHGETLSMKGLVLTYMGKKEDGWDLVKKGVRFDLSSHICWHVYGLLHKSDKNYEEAMKCYNQALKFDKDNMNILRDAAQLQAQLHQYEVLQETRLHILILRPGLRSNWIGLIVAYRLAGNVPACRKLLSEYLAFIKDVPANDVEYSELILYHIDFLEEQGDLGEALAMLHQYTESGVIMNRLHAATVRPRLLLKLGRTDEAIEVYRALVDRNPDCYESYRDLLKSHDIDLDALTEDSTARALRILDDLAQKYPKALVPQRLALTISSGDDFSRRVEKYLLRGLTRNVPSLFVDIKPLYVDAAKREIVEKTIKSYCERLETDQGLDSDESEQPTTYVWTLYFQALHYSYLGLHERAAQLLDQTIVHTPTLPELYMAKARNLKRAGDYIGAAAAMEAARAMDGQDRFLNTKCATYRLRAGDTDEAQKLFGMFTKKDAPTPGNDLEDMQSLKYLLEDGEALLRAGKLAMALKRFRAVDRIFSDIYEDQFDFHAYCLRRFTLVSYHQLIAWEKRLRAHPAYIRAVLGSVKIYLRLFDEPELAEAQTAPPPVNEEEKKAAKKAKKKAARAKAEETKKEDEKEDTPVQRVDDDPDGHKLIKTTDPLEQAAKLLEPLLDVPHTNPNIWVAIYDVSIRRKKYLQALRALETGNRLAPSFGQLHQRIMHFHGTSSSWEGAPDAVLEVLKEGLARFYPDDLSPSVKNSTYLQQFGSEGQAILATAWATQESGGSLEQAEETLFTVLQDNVSLSPKVALECVEFLEVSKSPRLEELRQGLQKRFLLSTAFLSMEEQATLKGRVGGRLETTPAETHMTEEPLIAS